MKRKRFSAEQIVAISKRAELIRQVGVSEQTWANYQIVSESS